MHPFRWSPTLVFAVVVFPFIGSPNDATRYGNASPPAQESRSEPDFFARLVGRWIGKGAHDQTVTMDFAVTAGGKCVSRNLHDGPAEMLTVYCLEGSRIIASHFSIGGKHSRLLEANKTADALTLRFKDGINVDSPADSRMDEATYQLVGADSLVERLTYVRNGQLNFREVFSVRRVKP